MTDKQKQQLIQRYRAAYARAHGYQPDLRFERGRFRIFNDGYSFTAFTAGELERATEALAARGKALESEPLTPIGSNRFVGWRHGMVAIAKRDDLAEPGQFAETTWIHFPASDLDALIGALTDLKITLAP